MYRDNWDQYFMKFARLAATRSTCNRLDAGAVIVKNRQILSTGYNGSMSKAPHCDEVGHLMVEGHCIRTVHAEINALSFAAKYGISVDGATIYINYTSCYDCFKSLVNAGIKRFIFGEKYKNIKHDYHKEAKELGIEISYINTNAFDP